jgi:hypothetical protein
MLSGTQKTVAAALIKEKPVKKARQSKKAQKVAKEDISAAKSKRGNMSKSAWRLSRIVQKESQRLSWRKRQA